MTLAPRDAELLQLLMYAQPAAGQQSPQKHAACSRRGSAALATRGHRSAGVANERAGSRRQAHGTSEGCWTDHSTLQAADDALPPWPPKDTDLLELLENAWQVSNRRVHQVTE